MSETADTLRPTSSPAAGNPLVAYVYSYPHKTAHRPLDPPVPLREAWAGERRDALFLYHHVPFCESRCGFCNLFSLARPGDELPERYLQQVRRQAERVRRAIPDARFARLAVGGGTPTLLGVEQLRRLLEIAEAMGADPRAIPVSVEASPTTVTAEKLSLLREFGVSRLSLGVQAFDPRDSKSLGRAQSADDAHRAIRLAREAGFPVLNVDLIYGVPGQPIERWMAAVAETLEHAPEEIYLYPLYIRPFTGLGSKQMECEDRRIDCYRAARTLLLQSGYRQLSFRMFRSPNAPKEAGPVYRCQEDGMIGLGCGARSYTRRLHYSTPYAVARPAVQAVLGEFLARPEASFDAADHGIWLDDEDQRRRYAILSLLQCEGLSQADYRKRFGSDLMSDLPQVAELQRLGLVELCSDCVRLTEAGLERSDAIGPWLFSERVRRRMETYAWRSS